MAKCVRVLYRPYTYVYGFTAVLLFSAYSLDYIIIMNYDNSATLAALVRRVILLY